MELLKSFFSLLSIVCLAGLIISRNALWAIGLLAFLCIRVGIMLVEKKKR